MAILAETSQRILQTLKREFIERVIPSHMLYCLNCLEQREEEEVLAKVKQYGNMNGAEHLWALLLKKPNWFEETVSALYHEHVDLPDLAEKFIEERGSLPVCVNVTAITHQYGTTFLRKSGDQESLMDLDENTPDSAPFASMSGPGPSTAEPAIHSSLSIARQAEVGSHILAEEHKIMLLDRFSTLLQGTINAEGRQLIEETLRNLELQIVAVRNGSIVLFLKPSSLKVLENVWEMHVSGMFAKIIHQKVLTATVMHKLRKEAESFNIELRDVHLTTTVQEKEYLSLKVWMQELKDYIVVQSPMESFCLYGKCTPPYSSESGDKKIRQLKALRKHLPKSVQLMVEDPFIRQDFIDNALETIFKTEEQNITFYHRHQSHLQGLAGKDGRRLVSEVMNWISTIYDDLLSKFDEEMQEILTCLALVVMGNICVQGDDTIHIETKVGAFTVHLEDDVKLFLKQELILLSQRMHFAVPNILLIGLETNVIPISVDLEHILAQDILFSVPLKNSQYRFVSNVLRDFLIGAAICYKTLPAVQRDVKTTLLQYFHKFIYLHIPVCNPITCQAAQSHNQVVINVYKEVEKYSTDMADEFAVTLLHSLEFCERPEAKGWLEYFGSKLKLVHSEGVFKRSGLVLSIREKQFLTSLITHDIIHKFTICDSDVTLKTRLAIKTLLEEFMRERTLAFRGSGIYCEKSEYDTVAITRSLQILDLINCLGEVELSKDGKLVCDLEKDSSVLEHGIKIDLSCNVMNTHLSQSLYTCFSTLNSITSLSLVNTTHLNLQWLRKVFFNGCLSNLRFLDLSENTAFERLNKEIGLKFCPDLSHLIFAKCVLGNSGLDVLCKEVKLLPKIRRLDISNNEITSNGLPSLASAVAEKYTITDLNMSGNHLGADSGLMLSSLQKSLPLLEVLGLSTTSIDNNVVTVLFQNISTSLKLIDITGNDITEAALALLEEIQGQLPNLTVLVKR